MKKSLISMLMTIFLMSAVCAQAEHVSVTELREQIEEMGRWTQSYEAHGRTIAVDVPVIVPEVERVPIVQVSAPLGAENPKRLGLPVTKADGWMMIDEDENLLAQLNGDDASGEAATVWCIDPEASERAGLYAYCHDPADQRLGVNWWYSSDYYYPYEVDPETVFAEENELSLADAQAMLKQLLTYSYGEDCADFDLNYIEVRGRARKRIGNRYEDLGDY